MLLFDPFRLAVIRVDNVNPQALVVPAVRRGFETVGSGDGVDGRLVGGRSATCFFVPRRFEIARDAQAYEK